MCHQSVAPSVGEVLTRACALTDKLFAEFVGDVHGLRRLEFVLLQVISRNAGINQKGLTEAVGVSAPQVSLVLDRMLGRGLVERHHSFNDGRQRCIQLTHRGSELARQANQSLLRGEALALSVLSPVERSILCELLLRVARAGVEKPGLPGDQRAELEESIALDIPPQSPPRARSTSRLHPSHTSPSVA